MKAKCIKYAILTTQRTGSSLLDEIIRNTKEFGTPREYLLSYRNYSNKVLLTDNSLEDFFRELFVETDYFGIKIMKNQFDQDIRTYDRLMELLPEGRFIFLFRENILHQAISWHLAELTNTWKGPYPDFYQSTDQVDLMDIWNKYFQIKKWNSEWADFLALHQLDFMEVTYEALIENPDKQIGRIANFLGSNKKFSADIGNFVKQMDPVFADEIIAKMQVHLSLEMPPD